MFWFDFREQVNTCTHLLWCILSVPATVYLWRRSRGNRVKQTGFLIFGVSMALCYLGSALYHGVYSSDALIEGLFTRLDYIGIYLLIAGTVTPVAMVILSGRWRAGTLIGAWVLAAIGVILRLIPWNLPPWFSNGLYLGMGWGVLLCYWELARVLSHRALLLTVAGGLFYSVGAVLNWVHWPLLWPHVFSTHEFFHLFVMAGTTCHFVFMVRVVVPYERLVLSEANPRAADLAEADVPSPLPVPAGFTRERL